MRPVSQICGIILSAGGSRRMGTPKALLDTGGGMTLLERQSRLLAEAGCDETSCVLGAEAGLIKGREGRLGVVWLINEGWEKGQFTSIQTGLAWMLGRGGAGAIVLPVDAVLEHSFAIRAIIETAVVNPHLDAIVPEHGGRGGHPVYISKRAAMGLVGLDPDGDDARLDVQIGLMERTARLPVNDPGILRNINTPEEWEKIKSEIIVRSSS